MRRESGNWHSFRDLATPGEASAVLLARYGAGRARRAAARRARMARGEDCAADYRFRLAVLCRLYGVDLDVDFGSGRSLRGRCARC